MGPSGMPELAACTWPVVGACVWRDSARARDVIYKKSFFPLLLIIFLTNASIETISTASNLMASLKK